MVSQRRKTILAALSLGVAGVLLWYQLGKSPVPAAGVPAAGRTRNARADIPEIGLGRMGLHPDPALGQRNIFDFHATPPPAPVYPQGTEPPPIEMTPTPEPTPQPTPAPTPLPLKYIGAVSNEAGLKVAVLLTDQKEILTGKQDEVVGNRYKITNIGLESVDVQDVASGHSQRIPLRGN